MCSSNQALPQHTELHTDGCFLPDLTRLGNNLLSGTQSSLHIKSLENIDKKTEMTIQLGKQQCSIFAKPCSSLRCRCDTRNQRPRARVVNSCLPPQSEGGLLPDSGVSILSNLFGLDYCAKLYYSESFMLSRFEQFLRQERRSA